MTPSHPHEPPGPAAGGITLALAGDTMLGRGVGRALATAPVRSLFGADLLEVVATTDGMLLNLECCLSERGEPWPDRVFHFRGPPRAAEALRLLGVRAVTLANNHALDFGVPALLDTLETLHDAGIATAGAGPDRAQARAPALLTVRSQSLALVSVTDTRSSMPPGRTAQGWPMRPFRRPPPTG
jgi:poly-gamma-glutamate capsule biosynthesis protein CapA/YwtB (metallophosphatase superfamily)